MVSVQPRGAILAVALLVAGCASAPQNVAQTEQPSSGTPAGASAASAASGSSPASTAGSPAAAAPIGTVASAGSAADGVSVVDLNKRPVDEAQNTGQICRQMLKPNTNSILTVCGTAAEWKKYNEAEAHQAEDNLLRWQAGRF
jgi:hypothetical protein